DAFLDEVERELARLIEENARLIEENNELRAALERGGGGRPVGDPRLTQENNELKGQIERLQREKAAAEQAARSRQAELEQLRAGGDGVGAGEQQALRVLMMAQRTADDHLSDARREAEQLVAEARGKAEELTREARSKAEALEREARQRHQEVMGGLEAKRSALQKHIEELKVFEREYRTRLKAYLESQLRDLEGRGQGLEVEMNRTEGARGGNALAGANAYVEGH